MEHSNHTSINARNHEKWNDEMAKRYDPDTFITKSGFLIRWVEGMRLKTTARLLDCRPEDAFLDVGCGAGNLLALLSAQKLVGIDLSPTLLDQARRRLAGKENIEIVKGDAEHLPFPDNSFDRLACSEVLEHVRSPETVLSEICRVAKPGARVVITVPNEDLINLTKRIVLKLGIKRWLAGGYKMSDDMLEEWHINEVTPDWLEPRIPNKMRLIGHRSIPFPGLAYHHLFVYEVLS